MELILVGTVDNQEVRFALVDGVHVMGRADDAAIKLVQPSISRRHAEIAVSGPEIILRDLGSHNGTKLNGQDVGEGASVRLGDTVEVANLRFRVEGPEGTGMTIFNDSATLIPSAELDWEEVKHGRNDKRDLQSLLFRVLAEAGQLLTIPRMPDEMYEPILDLVETALLRPERIFVLLLEKDQDEPVNKASRVQGQGAETSLALSRTMMRQVIDNRKSFLTSDPLNDPGFGGMMSMVSQGIRSAIAVPLFDNEEVIGLLYADDTRAGKRFSKDQLAAFTMLANVIAVALTQARYHQLEKDKHRQDAELQTAGGILDNILPAKLPSCEGYEVMASLEACFEVGGDLYDATLMSDGRYAFLIGDVVGKGLGAALLVSHILSWARFMIEENWEPEALITRLNRRIFECTDSVRFTTFFLGYLTPETGKITYVNAGHNPPYVVRADGTLEECPATGMPVGVLDEFPYTTGETSLNPGDMIALYSDGVPETQRGERDEDEYGEERFEKFLVAERTSDLGALSTKLLQELVDFRGDEPVGDDITMLLLRRN
ncbi:MAG: sigma-B regulation protein RsbU (phosphoserine phosphatase) [Candidatus Krumholzibacteriia bacterium]|jgi:sigma-B regulation protein RsbU (phosphoserine phosphatase)